jgi:hypothetical protein
MKWLIQITGILFLSIFLSCSENSKNEATNKLLGKWTWNKDDRPTYMKPNPYLKDYSNELEFFENGEYTSTISFMGSSTANRAKYKIENDTLYCFFSKDSKNPASEFYYWGKMTFLSVDKIEVSRTEVTSYLDRVNH